MKICDCLFPTHTSFGFGSLEKKRGVLLLLDHFVTFLCYVSALTCRFIFCEIRVLYVCE